MNAREMIEAVLSRVGGDATSFPRHVIAMRINSVMKEFARFFRDTFMTTATGTVTAGSTTITIPTDCKEIVSLQIGDYMWYPIPPVDRANTYADERVYWVLGGGINLRYSTGSSASYTLTYLKMVTDITDNTSEIEFPEHTREFVVTIVASRLSPKMVDPYEVRMALDGLRMDSGVQPVMKRLRARSMRDGYVRS